MWSVALDTTSLMITFFDPRSAGQLAMLYDKSSKPEEEQEPGENANGMKQNRFDFWGSKEQLTGDSGRLESVSDKWRKHTPSALSTNS
jgi:hypothetical protein